MARKVSELAKELEMSIEEIKIQSERLGIEIKTSRSSVSDEDAKRLISTMNLLHGKSSLKSEKDNKPKIKAVPLKAAPNSKPKPKKKADTPEKPIDKLEETQVKDEKAIEKNEKPLEKIEKPVKKMEKAEEKEKVEKVEKVKKVDKIEKKEEKPEEGSELKKSHAKIDSEKTSEEDSSKEDLGKEEKPLEKENKKDNSKEDYVNAPNKPMRFKKVFDASENNSQNATQKDKSVEEKKEKKTDKKQNIKKVKGRNENQPEKNSDKKQKDTKDDNRKRKSKSSNEKHRSDGSDIGRISSDSRPSRGKSKKFFSNDNDGERERKKRIKKNNDRRDNNNYFDERSLEKKTRKKKNKPKVEEVVETPIEELLPEGSIAITVPITVAGLSEQAEISTSKIIMELMKLGIMATINQTLDKDIVELLAEEIGVNIVVTEEEPEIEEDGLDLHDDRESELEYRAPVITVMGHVDHGKTSLLDAIRNTNVTAEESGGITQHIGASEIEIDGKKVVCLDTPGHEAFTTMRARGAQITDIAILVVAADDSVKPQTIESISHARAANVPIIVAINKIDKPGANPDKVKKDLADNGILVEDWGGDVISANVSAKTGKGIKELLEMILLQAEILELKANPNRLALGNVIEARLDKSKGPVATLLVMNGTLNTGQSIVAGTTYGRIRKMTDFKGRQIKKALPATPVEILGLNDVPMAGDAFNAVKDDKTARDIAENRAQKMREEVLAKNSSTTLEKLFNQIKEGETKELNLVIKGDVQGSVGAIISSLEKLNTDDVKVNVIHSGVGTITESDVMLAETSNAVIIGFNVRPTTTVTTEAAKADIEIRTYRVIYDIIDDVEAAMKGLLDPEFKEEVLGKVEVRDTFKVPNLGTVAGGYVTEGKIRRSAEIRLVRDGVVIHEGTISSLRRFKDNVKEVMQGYECGIGIEDYNDIKIGDVMECFHMVEVERN